MSPCSVRNGFRVISRQLLPFRNHPNHINIGCHALAQVHPMCMIRMHIPIRPPNPCCNSISRGCTAVHSEPLVSKRSSYTPQVHLITPIDKYRCPMLAPKNLILCNGDSTSRIQEPFGSGCCSRTGGGASAPLKSPATFNQLLLMRRVRKTSMLLFNWENEYMSA